MGILSWVFWLSPKCNHTLVLIRGRKREISDRRGEGNVIMETEIGVMRTQTKDARSHQRLKEAGTDQAPDPLREHGFQTVCPLLRDSP